jgi:HK97 gp10 family phage protein
MKTKRKSRGKIILEATRRQMFRAVSAGAKEAKEVAERLVRVDKGDLKSTIAVEDDGHGHAVFSAGGRSKKSDKIVKHALPNEFGTIKMPAQPFFRPGLDAGKRKMRSEMKIKDR